MKNKYIAPETDIILFSAEDILAASSEYDPYGEDIFEPKE